MTLRTKRKISNFQSRQEQYSVIAQAKLLRVLDMIRFLKTPQHIVDIAKHLHTHTRTGYRYLHLLEAFGVSISKDHFDRYFISQTHCPCCGMNFHKATSTLEQQWQAQKEKPFTLGKCTECGVIVSSETKFTICDKCWNPTINILKQ